MRAGKILSYSELARGAGLPVATMRRYLRDLDLSYQSLQLPGPPRSKMPAMARGDSQVSVASEIAAADARYRRFPDFAAWSRLGTDLCDLWERFAQELIRRREEAAPDQLERAVRVAVRAAALDSGALEGLYAVDRGFTMSVALQTFAWGHDMAERGEHVRPLFEAQLAGYELAIDAVTRQSPLSEAWLRVLHERLCTPQATYRVRTEIGWQEQPLPKGSYKQFPNHVRLADGSYHAYAPVALVGPEMHRLFEQFRTAAFEEAHPVEQAAYAHHALTVIHPFADGNGRVGRALASVYLYRSLSIPLLIFANQRPDYLAALAEADHGNQVPWNSFVADRGIDTMRLIGDTMRPLAAPQPDEVAERLARYGEIENLSRRLQLAVQAQWEQALAKLRPRIKTDMSHSVNTAPPAGYRRPSDGGGPALITTVTLMTPAPFSFTTSLGYRLNIALAEANPFCFQLEVLGSEDRLEIREAELSPELSPILKLSLDNWIDRHLGALLADLERKTRVARNRLS